MKKGDVSSVLVNIGFGNVVASAKVVAIVTPGSAPMKRMREEAKKDGKLVDATQGRRTRSIIITGLPHMVTDEKIYNAALVRFRLGTALIWLGVLTWLPFIALRIMGEKPSLLWFLPFHLAGVIGGSRLRFTARRDIGTPPAKKSRLRMLGHTLILLGILVWVPYLYAKLVLQQEMEVMNFLPLSFGGYIEGHFYFGA